jgi:hypothetical protein
MRFIADRWKFAIWGGLATTCGALVGVLVFAYSAGFRFTPTALYGVSALFVLAGLSSLTYSMGMPRASRWLLIASMTTLGEVVAWLWLSKALGQCTRSISGISVLDPGFICRCAFGTAAIATAYIVTLVVVSFMERMRSNYSIELTSNGLRPSDAAHVKRWTA